MTNEEELRSRRIAEALEQIGCALGLIAAVAVFFALLVVLYLAVLFTG